jgi:glycosyltransferase involved in cell wall biosynthesis
LNNFSQQKLPVSVLVPVKNEVANLERCLSHLQWADEIFVVDSQSTDGTGEKAEQMGAKLVQFHFNGTYPKKKNWSLENLPFRNEWVLIVDADEVIPPQLQREIADTLAAPEVDGYYLHFRYMFLNREIKHCGYSSLWVCRLFRHRLGRYERMPVNATSQTGDNEAHEHIVLKGRTGRMKTSVLHYAYPSISSWVEKHNRYSNWEAELYDQFRRNAFREQEGSLPLKLRLKRKLKSLYLRLPFRYVVRFVYGYILRLGFLDGKPGFILCGLVSFYDFLSAAKVAEQELMADKDLPSDRGSSEEEP